MATIQLLYQRQYDINDYISIMIPPVGDVLDNEDLYYNLLYTITAMPIDMMVALDDAGIDFSEINAYELFLLMFPSLQKQNTSLIFGDLDLNKFQYEKSEQNGMIRLVDPYSGAVIDRAIHGQIAATLRRIHHLEKNYRKPGNKEAKDYMLQRAREKMRRAKRSRESQLEQLIVAMVNTEQYKYGFEETRNLTIYQFNECVRQVVKKVDYEHLMSGVYAGTIDAKKLSQDEMNWLTHK